MRLSATTVVALIAVAFLAGYLLAGTSQQPTVTRTLTVDRTQTATIVSTIVQTTTLTTTRTTTAGLVSIGGKPADMVARVIRVVDGDTFDGFPSGRVRLADINTPERNQPGYMEATNALRGLIEGKTVYLDVDDVAVMDSYNRLVAVVYVDYNATHVLNVNLWLVVNRYAEIRDFRNEFNPSTWTLYTPRN
ncbi:MAG: thermonuclease family protein [Candidatus Caldarchaeum sp.]|uniref:TNase-like domain-containing protein n=1 Tax=Caldiarchaeum subterraneum TaxID=311458 RepID=A0A7C5Y4W7_CALS0